MRRAVGSGTCTLCTRWKSGSVVGSSRNIYDKGGQRFAGSLLCVQKCFALDRLFLAFTTVFGVKKNVQKWTKFFAGIILLEEE
jgi:hypothetical protein